MRLSAASRLNLAILYDVYWKRPQDALIQYHEYQRYAGNDYLMVEVWIRELESRLGTAVATAETAP